jgi:KUP system potassium uptake protein
MEDLEWAMAWPPTARASGAWPSGSVGVVFGDIGTSPLYAMREALAHSRSGGTAELAVLGVVSLVFWALLLIVTLKYVVFLMRADNKGEGGTLALMALAQRALGGKRTVPVFFLGVIGRGAFLWRRHHHSRRLRRGRLGGPGRGADRGAYFAPFILPTAAVV